MTFNNLEDVIEQKYKDIGQVRQEYPYVVDVFKNSRFAPEILQGLSMALEDFGDVPLIVRSSSLLEDRLGEAFAGKYKSLFISNQGSAASTKNLLFEIHIDANGAGRITSRVASNTRSTRSDSFSVPCPA